MMWYALLILFAVQSRFALVEIAHDDFTGDAKSERVYRQIIGPTPGVSVLEAAEITYDVSFICRRGDRIEHIGVATALHVPFNTIVLKWRRHGEELAIASILVSDDHTYRMIHHLDGSWQLARENEFFPAL